MSNDNCALTGETLTAVLDQLALICVTADTLKMDLEPLSDEDRASGAEPLSLEQIQQSLASISMIATTIAISHLKADSADWYAANDRIS